MQDQTGKSMHGQASGGPCLVPELVGFLNWILSTKSKQNVFPKLGSRFRLQRMARGRKLFKFPLKILIVLT